VAHLSIRENVFGLHIFAQPAAPLMTRVTLAREYGHGAIPTVPVTVCFLGENVEFVGLQNAL